MKEEVSTSSAQMKFLVHFREIVGIMSGEKSVHIKSASVSDLRFHITDLILLRVLFCLFCWGFFFCNSGKARILIVSTWIVAKSARNLFMKLPM